MATSIEAQGLTVDEAIQIALNRLGTSRDRVEIEIIHHPRGGFLGIGARRAKVRATLREGAIEDGQEFDMGVGQRSSRRRRRRSGKGRRDGEKPARAPQGQAEREQRGPQQGKQAGEQRERGRGRDQRRSGEEGGAQRGGEQRRRGRGDGRSGGARQQRQRAAEAPPTEPAAASGEPAPAAVAAGPPPSPPRASESEPSRPLEPEELDKIRERAIDLVCELLGKMGFDAQVSAEVQLADEQVVVHAHADAEGLLIGRRGQTLDALEHILNRMIRPGESTGEGAVVLDIGGYRERRKESLREMAARLRDRALIEHRGVQISPMSPRDRKVIQMFLAGDHTVETRTLGAGLYRRMQILPSGMDPAEAARATEGLRDERLEGGGDESAGRADKDGGGSEE